MFIYTHGQNVLHGNKHSSYTCIFACNHHYARLKCSTVAQVNVFTCFYLKCMHKGGGCTVDNLVLWCLSKTVLSEIQNLLLPADRYLGKTVSFLNVVVIYLCWPWQFIIVHFMLHFFKEIRNLSKMSSPKCSGLSHNSGGIGVNYCYQCI